MSDNTQRRRGDNLAAMYAHVLGMVPVPFGELVFDTHDDPDNLPRFAYLAATRDGDGADFIAFDDRRGHLVSGVHHDTHGPSGMYPVALFDLDAGTYEDVTVSYTIAPPRPVPGVTA